MQTNELYHFGIKGMKWGVRRFQNKDGTRTTAGKNRRKEYSSDYIDSRTKKNIRRIEKENKPLSVGKPISEFRAQCL